MIQKNLLSSLGVLIALGLCPIANAQLTITSATFMIQAGAVVTVQGDINSNVSIQGPGKVLLNGTANQNINMGGNIIPNLELNNPANVTLTSNLQIGSSLVFDSGKIEVSSDTALLAYGATTYGMGANKFFETQGTGYVLQSVVKDSSVVIPVGTGSNYTPVAITTSGSSYSSATVGAQAVGVSDPNKHPRTESYLTVYWPVSTKGVTGGTTSGIGTYVNPALVVGTQSDLRGMFWNGSYWSLNGGNQVGNTAGATIGSTGQLYAMNRFLLLGNSKVFLQAAYNSGTGVMNDKLRQTATYVAGNPPTGNLLPASDPYRTPPYSTYFTQVNDVVIETAASTVFYDQANANKNVVDWVFLQLRNTATSGNTVLQTRSALLLRDGSIVDIDGVSPVYFKNLDTAAYVVTVMHRNHLPITIKPGVDSVALGLTGTMACDFTTKVSSKVLGTAGTNYYNNGTLNMMFGGNANINSNVKANGSANDVSYILGTLLGGNSAGILSGVYSSGDVNMDRNVKANGSLNDGSYIFGTILNGNLAGIASQILPN